MKNFIKILVTREVVVISRTKVPDELIEQLVKGEVMLFLGEEMITSNQDEPRFPSPDEILSDLIARSSYPDDEPRTLPIVAGYYEVLNGRHSLVQYMIEHFGDPMVGPNKACRLAARLPCPLIVTTSFSRMLERALELPPVQPYFTVIGNTDVPYQDTSRKIIVKLCGSIDQPSSLVITEDDYAELFHRLSALDVVILSYFATKTLLFIGYDLQGEFFRHFYNNITMRSVDRHRRRAYAVLASPSPVAASVWARRDLTVVAREPTEFLEALTAAIASYKKPTKRAGRKVILPDAPYKFLDYFERKDALIFFGRDAEAAHLVRQVATHKLTVLVGQSGVGKTSLLNAGLASRLEDEGYQTVYVRALSHPSEIIKRAVLSLIGSQDFSFSKQVDSMSLRQFLESILPEGSRIIFLMDQFEEFFMRLGPASRRDFAMHLVDCMGSETHDLRFLLALRGDHLYHLLEMEPPIRGIFANRFWLQKLDESRARDAIVEPAKAFNLSFDEEFLAILLRDLETGGVDPSQLQVVCYRLYQALVQQKVFTLDMYQQLGGTTGILANYLDEVLEEFINEREREVARALLKSMVTTEHTRAALSTHEITHDAIVRKLDVSEEHITDVLKLLQNRRIIRRLLDEDIYELAHEVMVEKVWQWIDAEDITHKYVAQMLRQALTDWHQLRVLPSSEKWQLLNKHKKNLVLNAEEAVLMLQAALHMGEEMDYWLEQAEINCIDFWMEIESLLRKAEPKTRHNTLMWIASKKDSSMIYLLTICLNSELPALQRQARRALVNLGTEEAMSVLSNNSIPDEMVYIPSGWFIMGTDQGHYEDEQPAHKVYLDAYYIHRYPVTNLEYQEFVRATGRIPPDHWEGGQIPVGKEDHPVVNVSWYDAVDYCHWLEEEKGKNYRLPTEAEWEKAASWDDVAGGKRKWAWGDTYDPIKGNTRIGGPGTTTPIGQYSSAGGDSPYGLSDACGNTFDWIHDWWSKTYYQESLAYNPKGPETGISKVARGGSWAGSSEGSSAISRYYSMRPEVRNEYIGFRLASNASQSEEIQLEKQSK
jgi:formylglycine-generating enzyme required for sulfatase activity